MSGEKAGSKESSKVEKTSLSAEEAPTVEVDVVIEAEPSVVDPADLPAEQLAEAVVESEYVEEAHFEGAEEFTSAGSETQDDGFSEDSVSEEEKVHLEFYGSEYIRDRAPQVMDFAESVVGEWKKDGSFEDLPVNHPVAQMVAAKALRKAKDVEKVLEEKGVFSMARIGVDFVKSKIDRKHD